MLHETVIAEAAILEDITSIPELLQPRALQRLCTKFLYARLERRLFFRPSRKYVKQYLTA